ncbi:MAG TPA: hypothetical protein DCY35_06415, partial [Prolixibacteraceae bacterium]|nr:hypothetical protein [Prolixibacteraceae bacterium]
MKMNGLLRKLSFIFLLLLFAAYVNGQTVTTDKVDYMPGEKMIVSGKGWLPNESVNLVLTEQELLDPSWTDITKTVVCDVSGTFSIDLFELVQANL